MKRFIIFLFFFAAFCNSLLSQENKDFKLRTGFGIVPQYTINGGLRFDIDKSLSKTSNQWLILSPQIFWATNGRHNHDFVSLFGMGLDVKHKIYLRPENLKPEGAYVEYGVMFQYYSITDVREYTDAFIENGNQYYGVVKGEINTKLTKFGGNFHLGYQWLIGEKFYLDIYAGAGIRLSHNSRNKGFDNWYNNSWIDYGYSGTLLDGGFRAGFYF